MADFRDGESYRKYLEDLEKKDVRVKVGIETGGTSGEDREENLERQIVMER